MERLDSVSPHLKRLLGDGASNNVTLERALQQYRARERLAPVKVTQAPHRSQPAQRPLKRLRGETVKAQLQAHLHLSKHDAKRTWGVMTRIAAKVSAHRVARMVNLLLGRPVLQ